MPALDQLDFIPFLSNGPGVDIPPVAAMGLTAVYGLLSLLFGYRLIRLFIFLLGVALGAAVAHAVQNSVAIDILAGLATGGVFLVVWYLGMILVGAFFGILLAGFLGLDGNLAVCAFAIGGGVLAIVLRKLAIIVSTSWSGASALVSLIPAVTGRDNQAVEQFATVVLAVIGIAFQYKMFGNAPLPGSGTKS